MGNEKKPKPVSPATQLRRRKAVQNLLAGKSVKDSLVEAGYSHSTATRNPGEILKGLQSEFATVLNAMLPREGMVATLVEGLGATKATYIYNPKLGVTESFEQPDYLGRVKSAELLSKLSGFIVRKEQVEAKHEFSFAEVLAARRRAGMLPPAEPGATIEAQPVSDDMPAET